jgi:hypothetical protein
MWWGTWTNHVKGWWERAQNEDNVLFVPFGDMKQDLAVVIQQVAAFLSVQPLYPDELDKVVHKCGFEYMQQYQDSFEMHPPHLGQVAPRLFVSGSANRLKDVPLEASGRIAAWADLADARPALHPHPSRISEL